MTTHELTTGAQVAALWRYPIKGFTPEAIASLSLTGDGRAHGDRVWALRSPDGTTPKDRDGLDYWPKGEGLCLRDFPTLAALQVRYAENFVQVLFPDGRDKKYVLTDDHAVGGAAPDGASSDSGGSDRPVLDGAVLDGAVPAGAVPEGAASEGAVAAGATSGRAFDAAAFTADITEFLQSGSDADQLAKVAPLTLLGDGHTARFQDRPKGYLTAHNRASLRHLSDAMGAELDEVRFRSNVAIDGWPAWHEAELIGTDIQIGEHTFTVSEPIVRCLAVNANPQTGERDARVLQELARVYGRPEFGVLLTPAEGGGRLNVGDAVTSRAQTDGAEPESHQR